MAAGFSSDGGSPPERKLEDISVSVPESSRVAITPTIKQAKITSEQTAQFGLAVTWNGSESQSLTFGNEIPFSYPNYSSDSTGLVLLPANTSIERRNQETWVPKTDDTGHIPSESDLIIANLDPNETVSGEWEVWADPQHASQISSGTYRFENQIGLYSDLSEEGGEPITWILTIKIKEAR